MKAWAVVVGLTGGGQAGFHPLLSSRTRSSWEMHKRHTRHRVPGLIWSLSIISSLKGFINSRIIIAFSCLRTLLFLRCGFGDGAQGKGGGRIRLIVIFPHAHQLKLAWASPGLFWLFWLWSQFRGHEILSQLRDNQRKSEILDMNFKTLPRYLSLQAWHLAQWMRSVWYRWANCRFR